MSRYTGLQIYLNRMPQTCTYFKLLDIFGDATSTFNIQETFLKHLKLSYGKKDNPVLLCTFRPVQNVDNMETTLATFKITTNNFMNTAVTPVNHHMMV